MIKALNDIYILNATHSKELQKLQKFFEETDSNLLKDIYLFTRLSKSEILATIKRVELCNLCKSCTKINFSSTATQLLEDIVTDYELFGTSPSSMGFKSNLASNSESSRPIRSSNRYPNAKGFKDHVNVKDAKKERTAFTGMGESPNEKSESNQRENIFNISQKGAYTKTPHILRSRGKKMSLNPTEAMPNDSGMSQKERPAEDRQDRGSSYKRPSTHHIPSEDTKERFASERPAEERSNPTDLLKKQVVLKVNSARDQRLKELDRNSSIFEKRTKELVQKVVDCKYWIPVSFLIRLTYEQIEKNFPIEEPIDKILAPNDISAFLDELKVALECGKTLFSKSP